MNLDTKELIKSYKEELKLYNSATKRLVRAAKNISSLNKDDYFIWEDLKAVEKEVTILNDIKARMDILVKISDNLRKAGVTVKFPEVETLEKWKEDPNNKGRREPKTVGELRNRLARYKDDAILYNGQNNKPTKQLWIDDGKLKISFW